MRVGSGGKSCDNALPILVVVRQARNRTLKRNATCRRTISGIFFYVEIEKGGEKEKRKSRKDRSLRVSQY